MIEKVNNFETDDNDDRIRAISMYADQVLLAPRRNELGLEAIRYDWLDTGMVFDIADSDINEFCTSSLINPPTTVSMSAFGDTIGGFEASKRTLSVALRSREVNTSYTIKSNREWFGQVNLKKQIQWLDIGQNPDSVLISNQIRSREIDLLFKLLDYVVVNQLAEV